MGGKNQNGITKIFIGLDLDYINGQTSLYEDEKDGLRIPTITTHGDFDEFEQLGV